MTLENLARIGRLKAHAPVRGDIVKLLNAAARNLHDADNNRLSVYGEALPLLPLPSLRDPRRFGAQRVDGTQPFGPNLDGRLGFALRGRYDNGSGIRFSAFYTDNGGDQNIGIYEVCHAG